MKRKIVGIFVMTLLIMTALSSMATIQSNNIGNFEPPEIEWMKTFGGTEIDGGVNVQQTKDGGYIIAGYTDSYGAGNTDVYLIKTDENGNEIWNKTKGFSYSDYGLCVQQTDDDGYIVVGFSFLPGSSDEIYWIKTDADGYTEIETRGPGQPGYDYGYCVQQTEDGGYITVGSTDSFGAGSDDVYLNKKDSNLGYEWHKTYGGIKYDGGSWIEKTNDGGFIITGTTDSYGAVGSDIWLIKTDSNGNKQWDKTFGGSDNENGRCVKQTKDSGYIIVGDDSTDIIVIKTDDTGNIDWEKVLDYSIIDDCYSVCQTYDEGFFIVGDIDERYVATKLDNNGNIIWDITLGEHNWDYGVCGQQTSDGGYIIVGTAYSGGPSSFDVLLVKLETQNNPPNKPNFNGPNSGKVGEELTYTMSATDPDGDNVWFGILWDDGTPEEFIGPFASEEPATASHTWTEEGTYVIKVWAQDVFIADSEIKEFTVGITKNKAITSPFQWFLQQHLNLFPLLQKILLLQR